MSEHHIVIELQKLLNGPIEESVGVSIIRQAIIEIRRQDVIIDFLYHSLGPANDEVMDMAYEEADRRIND